VTGTTPKGVRVLALLCDRFEFDVDLNVWADHEAACLYDLVPVHPVIHSVDRDRSARAKASVAIHILDNGCGTLHVEDHLFGRASNGEVPDQVKATVSNILDPLRLEGNAWKVLRIKEIRAAEGDGCPASGCGC